MNNSYLRQLREARPRINTALSKYPLIPLVVEQHLKWKLHSEEGWTLLWNDHAITAETLRSMARNQKINHFPGMNELSRKNRLAKNLNLMRREFPQEYDFFPLTWCLPINYGELQAYCRDNPHSTLIVKPQAGCQGRGIYLTDSIADLEGKQGLIVQEYLGSPFLIDGLKFDFRIYVLITCVSPLRVYVYEEGLVRFATEEFRKPERENMKNAFTHLTNYAINKDNCKFTSDERDFSTGHKRSLKAVLKQIAEPELEGRIHEAIIKSVISGLPQIANQYRLAQPHNNDMCFEVLGFDIILNDTLKPLLLEVNHTPSFNIDTELDRQVKSALIADTLRMVHPTEEEWAEQSALKRYEGQQQPSRPTLDFQTRLRIKDQRQMRNRGGFQRIYPCKTLDETEKYDQLFKYSQVLYHRKYGTNIIRNQKRIPKEAEELLFVPRLTMQSDLYKVYTNNAGGSKQGARYSRTDKHEKKDTPAGRYEQGEPQPKLEQKTTHTNYKKISAVYGRRQLPKTSYKLSRSGNHFK